MPSRGIRHSGGPAEPRPKSRRVSRVNRPLTRIGYALDRRSRFVPHGDRARDFCRHPRDRRPPWTRHGHPPIPISSRPRRPRRSRLAEAGRTFHEQPLDPPPVLGPEPPKEEPLNDLARAAATRLISLLAVITRASGASLVKASVRNGGLHLELVG